MMLSMVSAFAADTDPAGKYSYEHTDTINVTINTNNHANFKAIQIFGGTQKLDGNDDNPLGDIVWGKDVAGYEAQIVNAVNTAFGTNLAATASAQDVAEAIAVTKNGASTGVSEFDDTKAKDLAQALGVLLAGVNGKALSSNTDNEVPIGYYLVIDTTTLNTSDPNKGDAQNASLLQFTRNITINAKSDAPNIEKKIVSDDGQTLVDSNTATIGDEIAFQVEGTIPDATYYDHYYYVLNDTLSAGLTFQNNVVVYLAAKTADGFADEVKLTAGKDYYLYTATSNPAAANGKTFEVALADIKGAQAAALPSALDHALPAGSKIYVRYTALLNSSAEIGETGNPNKVTLKYSNKPDQSEKHDVESKPGIPDSNTNTVVGETPEDITITYTAQVKVIKKAISDSGNPLAGAVFTLTGKSKKPVLKTVETFVVDATGTYYRLTDGTYTTEAPTSDSMAEKGLGNTVTSGYVIDSQYTDADKVVIGNITYRPYVPSTDNSADVTVYTLTGGTASNYASTTTKYKKDTVTTTTYQEVNVQFTGTSNAQGIIEFKDLGAGEYTLAEIVVPDGYNKAEDENFEIKVSLPTSVTAVTDKATWTVGGTDASDFTVTSTTGLYETTIVDKQGSTLPETGGMGTTILYIGGSILVILAAVLLITKRRMSAND